MINLALHFPEPRDAAECEAGWNGTPVPILQRRWEMTQLLSLYESRRPQRVLEVGTFYGGTLFHWLQRGQPGARVVSIDSYTQGVDNRAQYASWCAPLVECIAIQGNSQDAQIIAQAAELGPYDWIIIDADHLEQSVLADWQAYYPLGRPGGIIALHDIQPAAVNWIQVNRIWRRIQAQGFVTQEIIADPAAAWGGWGVIYL